MRFGLLRNQTAGFFGSPDRPAGWHQPSRACTPTKSDAHVIKLFAARASAELERKQAFGETLIEKERAQITLHSIGDGVITTDNEGLYRLHEPGG